ncbi:Gfo/Idh/MocA family protein [Roseivirga pacifica]|uniref:Gfo/Idh/MocA family protein n=1 Tax=Roseivirga pacifica TaxID=1267423 RepID=UPI0020946807|nr:Gfo/Idh/MocA family oxidoreductase [Roseivirga pacifica]MCO6360374.1 gfo/Idh/MocA family oxidoreductase [Roseivirga pacifica]MCO6368263.1 gfo/Idh/MocA family oxidoreductase [Roseivirga pacifica]MCO6372405.1 gfo/Idh/MocA family oxidoreductase [Roseivirga pacifica]MCO6376463.1 gfo/Idh/MocA family oxidoreductase [Roseivirga pacifica]MCO6378257.1 gfo/Idh/MocA family oxidoreductase [Roseivirga pacifica]
MLKIGVLGAGHLGKIHIKCIKDIPQYELVGFYDASPENAKIVAEELGIKAYETIDQLIAAVDVVDIVTPTLSHFDCAKQALDAGKHVFIEKPVTNTIEEAEELISLSRSKGLKIQVGHVERFNPAFVAAQPYLKQPMFIETHRLAQFNPRGLDVPVVLDLMIHDLDVILKAVGSKVKNISASGVNVVADTPDIANARLEFENGCVANLTTSRIAVKNMRKSRFFQKDAYIAVDFLEKKSEIVRMQEATGNEGPFSMVLDLGEGKGKKEIIFENPKVEPTNAIREELFTFHEAINNDTAPIVTIEDGYEALKVAHQILEKIEANLQVIG